MRKPNPKCIALRAIDRVSHNDFPYFPCICEAPTYEDLLLKAEKKAEKSGRNEREVENEVFKAEAERRYKGWKGKSAFLIQNPALISCQMARGATAIKRTAPEQLKSEKDEGKEAQSMWEKVGD